MGERLDGRTQYDAAHALAIRDAERAVIEAAEAFAMPDERDPWGYDTDQQYDKLVEEVRHLRAVRDGRGAG